MKTIQFVGEGRHRLAEQPEPADPPDDGVILEVGAVGICGSDLRILSSPMQHPAAPGVVLGHEISGVVRAVGRDVGSVSEGDHVAIDPAKNCGLCRVCRAGIPESCPDKILHGIFQDGGLRRYAPLPEWSLVPVSREVRMSRAALVEPLSCVLVCVDRARPRPGEGAAVIGGGPMGLLYTAVLSLMGADPLLVYEPHEARRKLALECGASAVLDGSDLGSEAWTAATGSEDPPGYVVDAVGTLLEPAGELVDAGGRIVLIGYNIAARPSFNPSVLVEKAVSVRASNGGFYQAANAARLLERDDFRVDPVVSGEVGLEEFDRALDEMRGGLAGKIAVIPAA